MKKIFQLNVVNKNRDRQVEAIKNEIRKYIKREKRKPLKEDVDFWKFECKFSQNNDEPQVIEFIDITKNIDAAHLNGSETFYMEIIATEGIRETKSEDKPDLIN